MDRLFASRISRVKRRKPRYLVRYRGFTFLSDQITGTDAGSAEQPGWRSTSAWMPSCAAPAAPAVSSTPGSCRHRRASRRRLSMASIRLLHERLLQADARLLGAEVARRGRHLLDGRVGALDVAVELGQVGGAVGQGRDVERRDVETCQPRRCRRWSCRGSTSRMPSGRRRRLPGAQLARRSMPEVSTLMAIVPTVTAPALCA